MDKLIVTDSFSHTDGEYKITYSTQEDPALDRQSGEPPAIVGTIELTRHGIRSVLYRWVFVPVKGSRNFDEYALTTPQVERVSITIAINELQPRVNKVYETLIEKLDPVLRREPMPRWKSILAILLFDAVFTFALWLVRIPAVWILYLQLPLLACSYLYFLLARRVIDRTF